jgi:putative MATE family efflux protein
MEKRKLFSNADLLRLFLPLTIEQGLEYTVGIAASMMVAQVGEAAVSGVSLVEFVMALIISIFAALAAGGSVVIGQYLGMKNIKNAKRASNQLVKIVLIVAVVVTILLYLCKPLILTGLFGSISKMVESSASQYFSIVILSVPFLALYNAVAAVFRTTGNAKLPMKVMLIMNVLNIIGNALLVGVFNMGVLGVAIPTLISRVLAALIILYLAMKKDFELRISNPFMEKIDTNMIKKVLSIGAPFGFENGMFHLGRLVVLSIVSMFGTASIAANSVSGNIVMFEVLPGMAINLGLSVIISRCVGAGDFEQAKYYEKKVRKIIHISFLISSVLIIASMPFILKIYNLSEAANKMTWIIVVVHALVMIVIWPSAYMLPIVFRGAADAKFPMIVSIFAMLIFRISFSYLFAVVLKMGMLGTWAAMFVDWLVKAIIFEWYYRKDKWIKVSL